MQNQQLKQQCRQVVEILSKQETWGLDPAGIEALAKAVSPFLQLRKWESKADEQIIRKVIGNYYLDGPMFQAMLTQDSPDGERLWAEWRSYMISLAYTKGLTQEQAEDLAQDVYLQTRKALGTFRFGSRLKTYFCGIFIKCYQRWVRNQRRDRKYTQVSIDEDEENETDAENLLVAEEPSPEEHALEADTQTQMTSVVQMMQHIVSSEDFQILYLFYVKKTEIDQQSGQQHKWTDKTIGERLDMPLNTVTSRRHRAIARLRKDEQLRSLFTEIWAVEST